MIGRRTALGGLVGLLGCSGSPVEAESVSGIAATSEDVSSSTATDTGSGTDTTQSATSSDAETNGGDTDSTTTTTSGQTTETGSDSDSTVGSETGNRVCGEAPTPSGGACPGICTDCVGTTCVIDCTARSCNMVVCPENFDCRIDCPSGADCEGMIATCSSEFRCEVVCEGDQTCRNADILCNDGPCNLSCGTDDRACRDLTFFCGSNDSVVDCATPQQNFSLNDAGAEDCTCQANGCE